MHLRKKNVACVRLKIWNFTLIKRLNTGKQVKSMQLCAGVTSDYNNDSVQQNVL
jgi:hypothetical protein